jgi:hypothetical protein
MRRCKSLFCLLIGSPAFIREILCGPVREAELAKSSDFLVGRDGLRSLGVTIKSWTLAVVRRTPISYAPHFRQQPCYSVARLVIQSAIIA